MTILEKKSERKKKAIMKLVENGEYSIPFAMMEAERLNDEGKLLDKDYEELMEFLESLLEPEEVEKIEPNTESNTEPMEEQSEYESEPEINSEGASEEVPEEGSEEISEETSGEE